MEMKTAILVVISTFFLFSCGSQDASVSALGGDDLTEVILDDDGNVADEEPVDKNEDIENIVDDGEVELDDAPGEEDEEVVIDRPIELDDEDEDGDIDVDDDEELICVERKNLIIEKLDESRKSGSIMSYKGPLSAAMNYNYYSASAHPIVGPHPEEYEGHFFFYEGKEGLSLNFFYNIDAAGSSNNQVKMEVIIKGNDQLDRVLLSDDGHEVKKVSDADGSNRYVGKMHYWYNTDGGVIGPLRGKDFKIYVKIYNVGDNKTVGFHSSNGESFALETGVSSAENYSEFVIYYDREIKDCSSASDDSSSNKNQCIAKVASSFEEEIHSLENWRDEYSSALKDRKAVVKEMALSQKKERKAINDEFIKIIKEISQEQREVRINLNKEHRLEIKACKKDKEARKSGECKRVANNLKVNRKVLANEHKEIRKAMHAQRKAAISEYNKNAKAKRKELSSKLLVEAKKLRSDSRSAYNSMMKRFQGEINKCSND